MRPVLRRSRIRGKFRERHLFYLVRPAGCWRGPDKSVEVRSIRATRTAPAPWTRFVSRRGSARVTPGACFTERGALFGCVAQLARGVRLRAGRFRVRIPAQLRLTSWTRGGIRHTRRSQKPVSATGCGFKSHRVYVSLRIPTARGRRFKPGSVSVRIRPEVLVRLACMC